MATTRRLNLDDGEIEQAGLLLTAFLRSYEQSIPARRVVPALDRPALEEIFDQPFTEEGLGVERLFQLITREVVPNSTTIAHPRFLAYVLPPPNGIAPFAEAIAAALNQNCNFWQLSPAASVIERKVIGWLAGLYHFPAAAGGMLSSGGSMATLSAIATALQDKYPGDFRRDGLQAGRARLVLYTSEEAHRSVEKNAVILGLGLDNVRKIPVDSAFRMRVDLLQAAVRRDREAGHQPFCVVATAGTVNTGAIDPIPEIARFCAQEDLWLHVDGAYGALFVLGDRCKDELAPCGLADSMSLDPHKMLFAPLEAGCLLVKDRQKLRGAFQFASSYLTVNPDPLLTNYLEYGPELSRSFKAFKIWCSLQALGVKAFVSAIDQTLDLAEYMAEQIHKDDTMELLAPVRLTAVCFRLKDRTDAENQTVLRKLVEEGTALLGPVEIGGRSGLRACIANYRTQRDDIDLVLDRIRLLAAS
ncbi:MAG TPA: pyridoxal-dependent decarboxylase [Bryobacteraceae bacterium]|nr:pyridoxal-dependent decarboxylase [Bryobacteraceae bacterium]